MSRKLPVSINTNNLPRSMLCALCIFNTNYNLGILKIKRNPDYDLLTGTILKFGLVMNY